MEKTIVIDDQEVKFKSTGSVPLRYKAQFQRDYFADIAKLQDVLVSNTKEKDVKEEDIDFSRLDVDVFYRIVWTLAKNADKEIPDLLNWLDEFNSFPIIEVAFELMDIITASIQSKKKSLPPMKRKKK
jgi:hypothetical protein